MRSEIVIFRGPSISEEESKKHLPNAVYLPPAMQGDMYLAYQRYKPKAMGLIDGNFERIPSPWHKEILYLISQGVKVFGAASMGALRAAELDDFGMIGVGEIYHNFTQNIIEDDDEVAILHAPPELNYQPISDAMLDIRLTLQKAQKNRILSAPLKEKLECFFKDSFYKERLYQNGIDYFYNGYQDEITRFQNWLPFNKVTQKKQDAISLLNVIPLYPNYNNLDFQFENTVYWHNLKTVLDDQITKAA